MVLHDPRGSAQEDGQDAGGERVERSAVAHAARGREPADEADHVVRGRAGRLGDDEDAVEAAAAVARAHRRTSRAIASATSRTRVDRRLEREVDRGTGGARVTAAREGAGQHRGVDSTGPGPDREPRRPVVLLLEQHRHLCGLGLGEQVDDPLRVGRDRVGGLEVAEPEGGPDDEAVRRGLEAVQDPAEEPELAVRLGPVETSRDVGERGPGRDQRRDTASVRGVAFGCANVAVSMTIPAMRADGEGPVAARSSGSPSRTVSSATSSQVAAAPGSIQSAGPVPSFDAWWSTMTRGRSANSPGWRVATAPTRSAEAQSASTSRS